MKSNKHATTLLLAMGLCLIPSSALAADPAAATPATAAAVATPAVVRQPAPVHKFLDGRNVMMFGISAATMAADIATTNRALQVPGSREMNPLIQSPASRYALKFAAVGAGMGISYMMHKTGHHKAERIVPLILGVPSAAAAIRNAGIHR
jgi:hypothetical protein